MSGRDEHEDNRMIDVVYDVENLQNSFINLLLSLL